MFLYSRYTSKGSELIVSCRKIKHDLSFENTPTNHLLSPFFPYLNVSILQLNWCHPYAAIMWSAHNSLKAICDKICKPEYAQLTAARLERRNGEDDNNPREGSGLDSYMLRSLVTPEFGKMFTPMLSMRTGFDRLLEDVSRRHREFLASEEAKRYSEFLPIDCLAFRHPAFAVEPKLDGERFVIHFSRDGIVRMQTRNSNWYR